MDLKEKLLENLQSTGFRGDLTVADAAARLGVSLDKAQAALFGLLSEFPGRLITTSEGELVFAFPKGLARRRDEEGFLSRLWSGTKRIVKGAARFVVRGWITVAILGYVAIFAGILIALTFARNDDSGIGGLGQIAFVLMRVAFEALWWTFHPFSPFTVYEPRLARRSAGLNKRAQKEKTPFYEKVNRFVFGSEPKVEDPAERERQIIAEIRAQRGRIGAGDVMRLTGVSRAEAEPLLARLMLDYEGEVEVSDDGGITYTFPRLRYSASEGVNVKRANIWDRLRELPALTGGNSLGSNLLIGGLNLFNLVFGLVGLAGGWTIEKITQLIEGVPPELITSSGTAIVLGIIPVFFSLMIFAFPVLRAIQRSFEKREVERENGRRGVLRKVLEQLTRDKDKEAVHLSQRELERAFQKVAGRAPSRTELRDELIELGADLDTSASEDGVPRWRFVDLEAEVKALAEQRAEQEAVVLGEAVYEVENA